MEEEGEAPPVDPLVAIEEKYAPQLSTILGEREAVAKQLEALAPEFADELAILDADYQKAKSAGNLEQQIALSSQIQQLQVC